MYRINYFYHWPNRLMDALVAIILEKIILLTIMEIIIV